MTNATRMGTSADLIDQIKQAVQAIMDALGNGDTQEDLQKAAWYLNREIEKIKKERSVD
jgi:hypothetical protein